jgi:hypothetical protein
MKHYEGQESISGINVSRSAPSISYLLFADDNLLFFKLNEGQASHVKALLSVFERGTGQSLSPAKCSMLVRQRADVSLIDRVKLILGVERPTFDAKYLGLPMPDGRMWRGMFQSIEDRYIKRMTDWKEQLLSQVAKEVLIKSVAQALPTYAMSVFKLPFGLCDSLEKHSRAFWWGSNGRKRKVQWLPWQQLVKPKCLGGLGFKDLRLFNQALLAHQAWRLLAYPDSLCARVLRAKYFHQGNLLDIAPASEASNTWRAIDYGVELLQCGAIYRVGNGESICIWRYNWIRRPPNLKPSGSIKTCRLWRVSQLMREGMNNWDEAKIRRFFQPWDVEEVLKIKIPACKGPDIIAWHFERYGVFSVRSAYRLVLTRATNLDGEGSSSAPGGDRAVWRKL